MLLLLMLLGLRLLLSGLLFNYESRLKVLLFYVFFIILLRYSLGLTCFYSKLIILYSDYSLYLIVSINEFRFPLYYSFFTNYIFFNNVNVINNQVLNSENV